MHSEDVYKEIIKRQAENPDYILRTLKGRKIKLGYWTWKSRWMREAMLAGFREEKKRGRGTHWSEKDVEGFLKFVVWHNAKNKQKKKSTQTATLEKRILNLKIQIAKQQAELSVLEEELKNVLG